MTALFLVGDVRERQAELIAAGERFDLLLCSPPFLALRSYLPADHPDKAKEIGSEATPAEFLDVLLELTAEWGRLLAPHGSIAVELGDTYAGSGGAGGDYDEGGLRQGQNGFTGSSHRSRHEQPRQWSGGHGWPLDKSLACIPQLYQVALAYGINPLTGDHSPAGRWRVRNLKPWIRSNPPVGALGDKERPATSYVVVATAARDRWFDLDAVRTAVPNENQGGGGQSINRSAPGYHTEDNGRLRSNAAGAPPRDWWHHVDAVLDAELALRAGNAAKDRSDEGPQQYTPGGQPTRQTFRTEAGGAQGVHLRRALERAGILTTLEALDVSPRGYSGAHYAVWPAELVRLLVDEMCPRRVCVTCGEPSRRIVDAKRISEADNTTRTKSHAAANGRSGFTEDVPEVGWEYSRTTLGWSDCGHGTYRCRLCNTPHGPLLDYGHPICSICGSDLDYVADHWRPGRILDPFVGSGTTLAVATGMGRDAVGIDIDERNADLARERVGMFLTVHHPTREATP